MATRPSRTTLPRQSGPTPSTATPPTWSCGSKAEHPSKMTAEQAKVVADHQQAQSLLKFSQGVNGRVQKLQDEYAKNGWGPEQRAGTGSTTTFPA